MEKTQEKCLFKEQITCIKHNNIMQMEESNDTPLEYKCFTLEEVFQRWQSQPESEEQWAEMTQEMQQALTNEQGPEIPSEIWKSNPSPEELALEYNRWCDTLQKECGKFRYFATKWPAITQTTPSQKIQVNRVKLTKQTRSRNQITSLMTVNSKMKPDYSHEY